MSADGFAATTRIIERDISPTMPYVVACPTPCDHAKGWISTSDHLPEDGQNVAFIAKCDRDPFYHGRVLGGRFTAGEFGGFSVPGLMTEASHWLALPPIPATLERKADA